MHNPVSARRMKESSMFRKRWWKGESSAAPGLSLALQGGGAHGAYTWGVLDRLLEDGWALEGGRHH